MIPSHFAALELSGVSLDDVRREYLDWILGHGDYRRKRKGRLDLGVHRGWTHEGLVDAGTSFGLYECSVSTRGDDGMLMLRFAHRDANSPSVLWYTLARARATNDSVLLEHGVARSSPKGVSLADVAAPPQVLRRLSGLTGVVLRRPKGLFHRDSVLLTAKDVGGFVRHVLADEARELPYVTVSVDKDGEPLLNPDALAKALFTLATVVVFEDEETSREFGHTMRSLGFAEKLGQCFHGAVRLYETPIRSDDSPFQHYLWLGDRIRELAPQERTQTLAGQIASRCARRRLPGGFFRAIERFDREQAIRRADSVLQMTAASAAGRTGVAYSQVASNVETELAQKEAELRQIRASLQDAVAEQRLWEEEAGELEGAVEDLRDELDRVEQERDSAAAAARALRRAVDASKPGLRDETRDAFLAVIARQPTLEQSLLVLHHLYGERLVVLDSAWESARVSESFRKREKAFGLLSRLVTDYWEEIRDGGDAKARKVFGREQYAATESETVLNNDVAVRIRTFTYKGKAVFMGRHLKIGTKDSLADTLRIHFHYDADEQRVVIGHCGGHLDFK